MSGPYYRLASPTQTEADAKLQVSTMMVCGRGARQSGGGVSPILSVKAYLGTLPANAEGIEFTSDILPSSSSLRIGGPVLWHDGFPGVVRRGSLACIPVTTIKSVH